MRNRRFSHSRRIQKQVLMVKRRDKRRRKNRTNPKQTNVKIVKSPIHLKLAMISQQRFLQLWKSTKKYFSLLGYIVHRVPPV